MLIEDYYDDVFNFWKLYELVFYLVRVVNGIFCDCDVDKLMEEVEIVFLKDGYNDGVVDFMNLFELVFLLKRVMYSDINKL